MRAKVALLAVTVAVLFSVIVVGAYVTVAGYGDACGSSIPQDWPGCQGGLFPPLQFGPIVEYLHRLLAALSTLFLVAATVLFARDRSTEPAVKKAVLIAMALLVAQVILGGVVIAQSEESAVVAAHQGLAVLTFGFAVAALAWTRKPS